MEKESGRRSRTRTGCLRCRQRKIRCDEGRPACQRCLKIKAECPGYEERTRLFGLRVDECFQSESDKSCYNSFLNQGVQELAAARPSSKEFWRTVVPQLADIHATVRHATIAIAVIREPAIRPNLQIDDARTIAYSHFNKAIRGFLDLGTSFGTIHKLTCCLLFNELMRILESTPAGGEHIKAARLILKEHETAVANAEVVFEPDIATIFAPMILRCTMNALAFLDDFETEEDVFEENQNILLRIPSTLNSTGDAVEIMDVLLKYAIMSHQSRSNISKDVLRDALKSFAQLLEKPDVGPDIRQELQILQIHQQVAENLLTTPGSSDLQAFNKIVELSQNVSNFDGTSNLGRIPPLFYTATRCSDKPLRKKAIDILHNLRISEGGLTSCMATRLAANFEQGQGVENNLALSIFSIADSDSLSEEQRKIGGLSNLQKRVVQAYGYSGILAFTPKIDCDCMTQALPPRT